MITHYGDEGVIRLLEAAKKVPTSEAIATRLQREQLQYWLSIRNEPDDVFNLFQLNKAEDKFLESPQFSAWAKYSDDFFKYVTSAEKQEEFEVKQLKIMRMIGTSVSPDVLQQIRDKETGSEMWTELCNVYEGKQNGAIKAYTIRRLKNELWSMKLASGGDTNLHLWKMF
ncbi:Multidrug resistance protein ABC Superfamily [Phytophthora cinnamomi]|uniref:Multidrug resistance protein ABC Superfamily n=1 Tax=Phytophthora cinnamomi TaxID=4785 RepID=UPI00355A305A|nr:Multidrug resistance protein ABC Superfamily [Phytophthora cinnamomi]